jgi:hypothetical protein
MTAKRFCARPGDDRGASMVLALAFITVVSLVIMATLTFADASMRATIALRGNVAQTAAAQGAAQVAINDLRASTYVGTDGNCFDTSASRALDNFYQRASVTDSARVECTLDPSTVLPTGMLPADALLGLDDIFPGVLVTKPVNFSTRRFVAQGNIHSDSLLLFTGPSLNIRANGGLSAAAGVVSASNSAPLGCPLVLVTVSPSPCRQGVADKNDPRYDDPQGPTTSRTPPASCPASKYVGINPGRITNVNRLNTLTSNSASCQDVIVHFRPGTYYLDFNGTWTIQGGYVIGGRNNTLGPGSAVNIPGMCPSPLTTPIPGQGVEFVLSEKARIVFGNNAQVELCGNFSPTRPPIVIYGLRQHVTIGGLLLRAITCIVVNQNLETCTPSITTQAGVKELVLHGTVYAPTAEININLNNTTQQSFKAGVIGRFIRIHTDRSSTSPVIEVPPFVAPAPGRLVILLNIYVCQSQPTCVDNPATPQEEGTHTLRVKVLVEDPAGARMAKVLEWSSPSS